LQVAASSDFRLSSACTITMDDYNLSRQHREQKQSIQKFTGAWSACYHSLSWFDRSLHWGSETLNVSISYKSYYSFSFCNI
jgi:hypothetical protein